MLFRVLGPLETHSPGEAPIQWGAHKPSALLATLLLNANEWVSYDRLIDAIWHDQVPPRSSRANMKSYVWQIRRTLPPAADGPRIEGRSGAYRVRVGPDELDMDRFKRHAADARQAMAGGDVARAVEQASSVLRLWRGRPFAELATDAVAPVVAKLEELRWELRETLADALIDQGRYREAIALLRELTVTDPLREGPWARLVRTLHRAGRRSEAITTFERARVVIANELGVDPGRELAEAHRQALAEQSGGPPASRRPRCDLPRDVPDFTGRTAEVARLTGLSRSSATSVAVAVIDGMPGVGKTALAVHVAHRIASCFPDGQLFIDLRTHGRDALTATEVLARLLRTIGVGDQAIPADVDERAAMWRSELAGRRMLLVLDDAAGSEQIRPLLPGSPGCLVLITTRSRLVRLDAVETMTLDPFDPDRAAALFLAGVDDWRAEVDPDGVRDVVRLCGGLPAAIRMATMVFRSRPQWTVGHLVSWIADQPGSGVAALVESSYRRLSEPERRMFQLVGLVPNGGLDLSRAAKAAGVSTEEARQSLEYLVDRNLLTQPAPGRYDVHVVVRDYARRTARALHTTTLTAVDEPRTA